MRTETLSRSPHLYLPRYSLKRLPLALPPSLLRRPCHLLFPVPAGFPHFFVLSTAVSSTPMSAHDRPYVNIYYRHCPFSQIALPSPISSVTFSLEFPLGCFRNCKDQFAFPSSAVLCQLIYQAALWSLCLPFLRLIS